MFRTAIRLTRQLHRTGRLGAFIKDTARASVRRDRRVARPVFVMSPASSGSTWIAGMLGHMPHHVFVHEVKLCGGVGGRLLLALQSIRWLIPGRLLFAFFETFQRARLWTLDAHLKRLQDKRSELLSDENLKDLQIGDMAGKHWAYDTIDSSGANVAITPLLRKAYPNAVFCFILRDPRDVCMSIIRRKPWGHRHAIDGWAQVLIKDYKLCERYKSSCAIDVLRYESWLEDTAAELRDFVARHGLDMSDHLQAEAVQQHNAAAMKAGKVAAKGNLAVARSGAWAESISPTEKDSLKPILDNVLIELGYESNSDW